MPDNVASLQRQLENARENLKLIEERMAEYVLSTDVPLMLVREKRLLEERIAGLEIKIRELTNTPDPGPCSTPKGARGSLTREHLKAERGTVDKIKEIIYVQASHAPLNLGARGYMALLIQKTNWPDSVKVRRRNGLIGAPELDATDLVRFACDQGTNPDDARYTFIGGLLEAVLAGGDLDAEDQAFLKDTIVKYSLIQNDSP
jgi:hypothetical protein